MPPFSQFKSANGYLQRFRSRIMDVASVLLRPGHALAATDASRLGNGQAR
jgi:hypothetical protein